MARRLRACAPQDPDDGRYGATAIMAETGVGEECTMGKIPVSDPIRPRAPHLGDLPFAIIPDARRRFTGIWPADRFARRFVSDGLGAPDLQG